MVSANSRFSFMGTGSEVVHDFVSHDVEVHAPALPFEFIGGYVGYLGYPSTKHRSPFPDACLLRVDRFLAIDHAENTLWLVSCGEPDQETERRIAALEDRPPVSP